VNRRTALMTPLMGSLARMRRDCLSVWSQYRLHTAELRSAPARVDMEVNVAIPDESFVFISG
jgi:hypothetical protein